MPNLPQRIVTEMQVAKPFIGVRAARFKQPSGFRRSVGRNEFRHGKQRAANEQGYRKKWHTNPRQTDPRRTHRHQLIASRQVS